MALIKKFKSGDKTEEPKKVLTRQNIGDYDADELAKSLTDSLQSEADKYKGSDRQAFLKYGSQLVQAVKDGNVTINTDGSISINGNYGLNNDYTDKEIQDMKDNGKVGRGASAYQGEYQKSHGIFTTNGTEKFRNDNHLIGLTGRWLMNNLNDAKPIVEKPAQEAPKYTFDTAFADKHLNGVVANKAAWFKNNTEATKKIQDIIDALNSADKEKWGMSDKDFSTLLSALEASKESKDYTAVKNAALNLGFDLSSYLPGVSRDQIIPATKTYEQQLDDLVKAWESTKATELYPEWGAYSDDTKQGLRNKYRQSLIDADKKKALELENENRIQQFINNNQAQKEVDYGDLSQYIRYQTPQTPEEYADYIQRGYVSPWEDANDEVEGIRVGPQQVSSVPMQILYPQSNEVRSTDLNPRLVAKLIELYNYGDSDFNKDYYYPITEGEYKDWIAIPGSIDDNGQILVFKDNKAKRINITALKEGYKDLYEHFINTNVKSHKQGGNIQFLADGNALTASSFIAKRVASNTEARKQMAEKKKQEKAQQEAIEKENAPVEFESTKLKDISDWDYTDWANATSAALDVASLATSLTTSEFGGSLVAGGLGLASTISEGVADYGRAETARQYWDATKNVGTNLFFDAVGLLPWGRLAKSGKTTAKALKYVPYVGMAATAVMAPDMAKSFMDACTKVFKDPDNLTTDDLRALTAGAEILTGFTQAKRANRVADTATPAGMEVKTNKGTVKVDQKTLEEMQNASSYEAANKIFRKTQGEKPATNANVPGGIDHNAKPNPNIHDLPQGTKWGNNKEGSWYSWRVPNGKPIIEGKLLRSLDDQVVVPGLLGNKVINTKGAQKLTSQTVGQALSNIYTHGIGEGLVRATGAVGRTVADGISTATRAGRHKLKRYSYKELGLDPKKQYTAQEFTDAVKAYEHKQGLLDAIEQNNTQVKKRAKRIADIRRRNAQAESKAKTEAKAKEIREKVQKLFNDKSAAIRTKTTGLMQRFNERLEEYQTAKRRERNLRDIELQNKRDSYNSPEARAARKAAEEQQQAIRSSLARQMFGGPYYASLSEPLQIKGLEVPSLSKAKPETPAKKTGHVPKKTKNKRHIANKASEGMKFAQAAISNINKSEDLETLWLKAGGRMIPKAERGFKVNNRYYKQLPEGATNPEEVDIPEDYILNGNEYVNPNVWTVTQGDKSYRFNNKDWANTAAGFLGEGATSTASYEETPAEYSNLGYTVNGVEYANPLAAKAHAGTETVTVNDATIYPTFGTQNQAQMDLYGEQYAKLFTDAHRNDRIASKAGGKEEAVAMEGTEGYKTFVNFMQEYYKRASKNDWESTDLQVGDRKFDWTDANKQYAQDMYKKLQQRTPNHKILNDDGTFTQEADTYLLGTNNHSGNSEWYDHVLGNYHQYAPERAKKDNNYLVDGDKVTLLDNIDGYELIEGMDSNYETANQYGTNKYYRKKEETHKPETKEDSDGNKKDKINVAGYIPQVNLNNTRQLGNVLEGLRTAYLNRNNRIAAKEAMDWDPALKQQLHRIELLEGNYQALREAQNGRERLNSQASRTFTSDAALQLAGQLTATAQGNTIQMDAAKADADRFYNSRHKVIDLANQDLVYNTQVGDYNRGILSQYGKEKAGIKANLRIENAKNWGNFLAGISKQMFDAGDRENQLALQHVQTVAGNANQAAYLKYLKDNDIDAYYKALQENAIDANKKSAGIIGFRPFSYTTVNKKGGSLTPTHRYILQGSKDFNKRKLEEAREFHKNMRKKK